MTAVHPYDCTLKPVRDLTLPERAAVCVFIVEGAAGVRYVDGITGASIAPDALVAVPGSESP